MRNPEERHMLTYISMLTILEVLDEICQSFSKVIKKIIIVTEIGQNFVSDF